MADNQRKLAKQYLAELDSDPKYSLEVDPNDNYKMTDEEKDFIKYYIEYKNIPLASKLAGIKEDMGVYIFKKYNTRQEIRRINAALFHRRKASKILNVEEIGSYLSSIITGENVTEAEQNSTMVKDKLKAVQMLLGIHELKGKIEARPEVIDVIDIQEEIKNLDANSIKKLIDRVDNKEKAMKTKENYINKINKDNKLMPEEKENMITESDKELKKQWNANKGEKK